jgi:fatty-acyl-CoA synthase
VLTIDTWISGWARHRPHHEALREGDDVVSYADLERRIGAAAADLARRGVGAGDRVGFCGLNRIEQIVLLFACARIGAILVPLNNRLSVAEHRYQIDHAELALLFVTDGFAGAVTEAAGGRPVVDLDDDLDDDLDGDRLLDGPVPEAVPDAAGRDVLMVYTSGTTGRPKGAVHTQRSLLFTVLNGVAHQDLHAGDRVLTFLPIFHVGGLNIQTLPGLYVGASVELIRRFDPGAVLGALRERRHTQTLAVPATMTALLDHPDLGTVDWSCLRGLNSGSSVVPPALIERFHALGVPVGQVYGSTETGPTAVVLRFEDAFDRVGSCGKAALHSELRLVDGELWVRGPHLFDRYWRDPAATAEVFVDGWYRTGDLGHVDEDGFVVVDDRLRDVVISGGENVYPAEVELVLAGHPAIAEVAVIGRPDDRWGEAVVAFVVLRAGSTLSLAELRAWCEGRLARYKQPQALQVVDSLPRTALGKVTKHVLRAGAVVPVGTAGFYAGSREPSE